MQNKPLFYLFLPRLFDLLNTWHHDFLFEVNANSLSTLFSQYTKAIKNKSQSLDDAFFHAIQSETVELPVAYYRYQVHIEEKQKEKGLICADPVYLEVGMNDVMLTDKITDLTEEEAKELLDILNNHFSEDGLQFIFGSNQCWYVSYPDDETVHSYDLDSVFLKNVTDKLLQSDERNWQVIQNEAQMLLHSSEINKQREIAGLKPVNSLWFWGAGKPIKTNVDVDMIYSSNEEPASLRAQLYAKAASSQWGILPENMQSTLDQLESNSGTHMFILDQLFMPAIENRLDDFQLELERIDSDIIKPLLQAWQNNQIDIIIDCCDGKILKPEKVPAWKFWIKPKSLREIAR